MRLKGMTIQILGKISGGANPFSEKGKRDK
jgi:hypothetical protein